MSTAVILSNGTPPSRRLLEEAVRGAACFVCADGGANAARAYGLIPEAVIGDLDSITPETLRDFSEGGVRVLQDQDPERTDTEKAVEYVLARGAVDEIALYGASAGRLDHVLGHVSLLLKFKGRGRLVLEDDHARAWLAGKDVVLDYAAGTIVSFFAVGEPAEGITTENLRYPLRDRRLELGAQDSVSNEVAARPGLIRIGRGALLVVVVTRP